MTRELWNGLVCLRADWRKAGCFKAAARKGCSLRSLAGFIAATVKGVESVRQRARRSGKLPEAHNCDEVGVAGQSRSSGLRGGQATNQHSGIKALASNIVPPSSQLPSGDTSSEPQTYRPTRSFSVPRLQARRPLPPFVAPALSSPSPTVRMVEIEIPDAEELGGNVTKPFKFVTGMLPA